MKISLLQTISADHMELKEYCMDNGIMSVHVLSYGCALPGCGISISKPALLPSNPVILMLFNTLLLKVLPVRIFQ